VRGVGGVGGEGGARSLGMHEEPSALEAEGEERVNVSKRKSAPRPFAGHRPRGGARSWLSWKAG